MPIYIAPQLCIPVQINTVHFENGMEGQLLRIDLGHGEEESRRGENGGQKILPFESL
jgi:hypothetical protein